MGKRIGTILLCLALLCALAIPVFADETQEQVPAVTLTVTTEAEFLTFAENCRLDTYSQNISVELEKDLDLTGRAFEAIPIFSGSFDGNGHKIYGLSVSADGSQQGLFRILTADAVVKDLAVQGEVRPGGSRSEVGGIAGRNEGQILGCSFTGIVSGGDYVGGLVGSNGVFGVIESCRAEGQIHGDHFVGGIAGENLGVIRSCGNSAQINNTPQQNSVELSGITMDTLTNTEAANTVTDIGGIAGISSGVIRQCQNTGNVGYRNMGYNVGGIAGTQSGYLAQCENRGSIQGRKEVGGIVGQMEPTTQIQYDEDTLQILQGQMNTMSTLVNRASSNAQTNASKISGQIGVLQQQTKTAQDAVESLLPKEGESQLPDRDQLLAAQSTLSNTLNAMPDTLKNIAASTQSTVSGLNRDLNAISGQMNAMGGTLNNASENLGGSVTDISDADTPEDLTGKVESCVNSGNVFADLNTGGIAGAIAMENDLDLLQDWEQQGDMSLNFQSQVRGVILSCENRGAVTGKKQNSGGIVGWQSLGLVKNCTNTGLLDCEGTDYAGGISGRSTGFIRNSFARCQILASTYVGGIAGSASVATDCLAQVLITQGREKLGAVLGSEEESTAAVEAPIRENYYLCVDGDYGAIDGISYAGRAEAVTLEDFLQRENLPEQFQTVTVRFLFADGAWQDISLAPGKDLSLDSIPAIPEKEGFAASWEGLEESQLQNILFDRTYTASYTAYGTAIASAQTREKGLPLMLAEGTFTNRAEIAVTPSQVSLALKDRQTLLECWSVSANEPFTALRFRLPENADAANMILLVEKDGKWEEVSFRRSESYLVFAAQGQHLELALVQTAEDHTLLLVGIAVFLVLVAVICIVRKKRKK